MKKLKLFFVAMLLSAVAVSSYAWKNGDVLTKDGFKYSITNASTSNPTVSLTSADASTVVDGTVTVPATVFDDKDMTFTVTSLENNCSFPNTATSIVLPETLKTIGYRISASSLTSLKIPSSVTTISGIAFVYLSSLESFSMDNDGNGTYSVKDGVLYSNNGKTVFSYPRKKPIENGEVILPEGVENISITAFYSRTDMVKLTVPSTMISIQSGPSDTHYGFEGCTNLAYVEVNDDNPNMCDIDGVVFDKAATTLTFFPWAHSKNETYVVPDGVTKIADRGCMAAQFKVLDLNRVEELGTGALGSCNNLEEVIIPACLEEIPEGSITGTKIQKFTVREGNPTYASDDYGVLFTADRETLLLYPAGRAAEAYPIPEGTITIGRNAFKDSKVTEVTIPETVTTINMMAFYNCDNLESITIPEGVTSIPGACFYSCGKLSEVNLPDGLKTIAAEAFQACVSLESITIPSSVTNFGNRTFIGCTKLSEMIFEEPVSLKEIPYYCFYNTGFTTFTIPKSVTAILADAAFGNCSNLEEIIVPDGSNLERIGGFCIAGSKKCTKFTFEGSCDNFTQISLNAFNGSSLTSFDVPASTTTISTNAFFNCKDLAEVTFTDNPDVTLTINTGAFADCGIESLALPVQVKSVGKEAFRNCDVLESVSLSKATTYVDPEAFKFCSSLKEFTVDKENTVYSSSDGILLSKDKTVLRIFPEGKANSNFTLLPPSITTIGDFSFYSCEKLENVTIPNKVTKIDKRAFGLCKNLNTVTFLCDEMIDPANIAQALNEAAIDDGVTTDDEQFSKITLNVRKELLDIYAANEYYQKFKEIKPSFIDETTRVGGLNKTKAKEEFIAVSQNTVDLLSVDTDDETYVLPTTVENEGTSYNVGLVGDYLFTANGSQVGNVKEVVVPGNVQYIGARAFMTDPALSSRSSNVESVFLIGDQLNEDLLSTARFELTPEDLGSSKAYYDEFGTATKIYVRKSAEETYKDAWTNYTDNISYKIPYTQSGTYGTFAREFDVDFSEVNGVNAEKPVTDDPVLIAFTGNGKYVKSGDAYSVLMTSINLGDQEGKDGTYVPAGSGVLMKKYKDAEGEDGLYYQIAETGISDAFVEGNFMKGITLRSESIDKNDGFNRYYISGGKLHEMTKTTTFKNHKSFLEIATSDIPAGAKVSLTFTDWNDIEATGIESVNYNVNDDDNLYNLQGQRVNTAGKGIYIKNGKKIFVK